MRGYDNHIIRPYEERDVLWQFITSVQPRALTGMKVKVRVTPDSRRERFEKTGEFEFSATIKERPEKNQANTRVQELLAEYFNLPVTSVRFLTGMRGRVKTFDVIR